MARTIKQIKKLISDEFMASENIRKKYGLSESDTFENAFSAVSFESILFGIVASAIYILESLFDLFKSDVDSKISTAILSTIPWYHKIALEYQHGNPLVLDESTMQYVYETQDPDKQVVKFAACRDNLGYVAILAAGADNTGRPVKLPDDILTPFKQYMNDRKPAGIPIEIHSYDPDMIKIELTVQYDPLLFNADGSLISDPSSFPVEQAVTEYLYGIEYGGVMNKTKLVDAVQSVAGVRDVILGSVQVQSASDYEYVAVAGNNYKSFSGAFAPVNLRNTISYVLQV